jgi:hypothetical protein
MKNELPRRRHPRSRSSAEEALRRLIMQALQAPVPPRLKTWVRI